MPRHVSAATIDPAQGVPMKDLPDQALERVAAYFQALAEPTRLRILNLLRNEARNVGDLARLCGYTAANVSRHLTLLMQQGFVTREGRGTSVYYAIADPAIYALCDLVCTQISKQLLQQAWPLSEQQKLVAQLHSSAPD